ncbi:MAG TPA: hypothetical protein VEP50_10265, partial [bacterium]|nr:hypothetical protein [bacterium]
TGADSNGDPCVAPTGAEAVVVSSLTTTPVRVQLTCAVPTDAAVDCPSITSIAVGPVALEPGQTADLISLSTSVSAGTETYLWTASCAGATITNATSANATFACGSATGACRITLTVNLDGVAVNGQDAGSVCPGTAASGEQLSDDVFCPVPVISCSSPTPKACVAADGGPFCTTLQLDANNCGSCGTVCPAATPACIAGTCVPPPPPPCTTGPCAPNTVQCQGNTSPAGVCTATEAAFVQQDITAGVATTGGPDPAAGCYSCLLASGCLDDETFGDTGHECGIDPATGTSDLAASFTNGSGTLVDATSTCLATLECLLTTGCANAESGGLTNCFCGSEGSTPSACAAASAVNGPCDAQEAAGFSHPITDPSDILSDDFTNTLEPSGMANQILECGKFVCPQCL